MTVEQAFYFKIMLICGCSDELFEYIENTLNEQTSYEEVIVDLAFCGYNEKQMLSVLESYIRQKKEKVDYDVIIESIFNFLQNKYLDSETSVEALVKLMYRIGQLSELNSEEEEPWFTMMIFDTLYEDAEEGYIDKDGYLACLKSFIFEREYCSDFQIYKPVKQLRIKTYLQNLINRLKLKLQKGR